MILHTARVYIVQEVLYRFPCDALYSTPLAFAPTFSPSLLQLRTHAEQPLPLRLPIGTKRAYKHILEFLPNGVDGTDKLPTRTEDRPEPGTIPDFEQLVCDVEVVGEVRSVWLLVCSDRPDNPVVERAVCQYNASLESDRVCRPGRRT